MAHPVALLQLAEGLEHILRAGKAMAISFRSSESNGFLERIFGFGKSFAGHLQEGFFYPLSPRSLDSNRFFGFNQSIKHFQ
jgi:hypothetical protein